jgi:hypothetical protein
MPQPCKPGNGFGDKNHCHTGPPGHDNGDDFFVFLQHLFDNVLRFLFGGWSAN